MSAAIDLADVPLAVRKKLGLKQRRTRKAMSLDRVRGAAIRVLAVIHELTPSERARVLKHALRVNAL